MNSAHVHQAVPGPVLVAVFVGHQAREGAGEKPQPELEIPGGVETEQGVICPAGVVGKVIKVGPTSCLVQLATDTRFAMAARLQRNRLRGIVRGTGDIECELLYIRDNDSIRVDDLVVSSGLERIFPIGVPVGVVVRVGKGEPPFRRVLVLPSTDFRSLEWVMIVTGRQAEAVDLGGEGR